MKIYIAIFLLISIVASQSDFLSVSSSSETIEGALNGETNMEALNAFYNAMYGVFGMNQTVVNQCFNESNADDMFIFYILNYELASAVTNAERSLIPIIAGKIQTINQTLYQAVNCYQESQNFEDLLAYFGMNFEGQSEFDDLVKLYEQAHINDVAYHWPSFVNLIESGQYAKAGAAYAPSEEAMYTNASQENSEYEIFKGIQNGVFFFFNISAPYSMPNCYNVETGSIGASYYNGWATAAVEGSSIYAVTNTYNWRQNNEELIQQLGILQGCFENTEDQARLNTAVGYNVNSEQFEDAMNGYMTANPLVYWGLMKTIFAQLNQQNNPLGAGMTLGSYYWLVANSISEVNAINFQ